MESSPTDHLLELLAMSPTMIYTCRPDGDFGATSVSDNFTAQLGYQPVEFLEDSGFWADRIHPDDRAETIRQFERVVELGVHAHEYRFRHQDGSYRWMNDQIRLLRDEHGQPVEIVGYWVDMTAHKDAQEALRVSEQRFELAVTGADGGLWDKDFRTGVEYWAPRFYELIGYEFGDIEPTNSTFMSLIHPDDRENVRRAVDEHVERRAPTYEAEYRFKTKSGEYRWFRSRARALWDEADTPARLVGFITDITDRKRAEQALHESDLRFNLAVAGANEGLWDRNFDTGAQYWAPRFYTLLGYEVGEIEPTDETLLSIVHPDDRARVQEALKSHVVDRVPYDIEYRYRGKSGEYRWFRSRGRAIWNEDGRATRMVGFIADTTEQRRLQATLRETQQILDSTPDPTVIVDDHGKIVFTNSKAAAFGYDRVDLLGCPMTTILPGFDRVNQHAAAAGMQLNACRKDGSEFPVEVSLSPIETDSGTLIAAAIRDVTDRKAAEQLQRELGLKLQQAQKLESLGVLAGGIAHDFNNLLMGMLGNAEVALAALPADAPVRQELMNISSAAMRAADLTKQMLAYSGRGRFHVEPRNLTDLVQEIGHLLDVSIRKNVTLHFELADDLPPFEADASQVQQIIMNFIINASEAIGESPGQVTVATRLIHADRAYLASAYVDDELPEGDYVCLEVSDTGCGMDARTQQKIFDPFFTTKFTGRGLGLAAVLGIIRGHDGTLKIESRPGVGSTFTVLFPPLQHGADAVATGATEDDTWRGSGLILVVDDETAVRVAATRMIETHGFTVLTAVDGHDALDVFRRVGDDVVAVLLDMTMPVMNGEDTFHELRKIRPDVKVILSSGFNEEESTSKFLGSGLAGFIQKPYGMRALTRQLRAVLDPPSE